MARLHFFDSYSDFFCCQMFPNSSFFICLIVSFSHNVTLIQTQYMSFFFASTNNIMLLVSIHLCSNVGNNTASQFLSVLVIIFLLLLCYIQLFLFGHIMQIFSVSIVLSQIFIHPDIYLICISLFGLIVGVHDTQHPIKGIYFHQNYEVRNILELNQATELLRPRVISNT